MRLACIGLSGVWNWRGADDRGAVKVLQEWDEIPLKHSDVYVVFDSDVMTKLSVKLALERLGLVLKGRGATVHFVYLPDDDGEKQGLDDYFAGGGTVDDLLQLAEDRVRGLPGVILNGRQQREVTTDAVAALERANDPPQVFRHAQGLSRVLVDEHGRPFIQPFDAASLRNRLTAVGDFYRVTREGERIHAALPDWLPKDVLALPAWDFPALESVVETPTIGASGEVVGKPGYDPLSRLVYVPAADFVMPEVPVAPSEKWLRGSVRKVLEVIEDFPFVDEASRANAVAMMLTPLVRPAINGPVSLVLIDAPQAGTGKSLLAEATALIATGRNAEMMSPWSNEEEGRKQITATLR
jgi:hypothetical protein